MKDTNKTHATETPDVSYIKNVDVTHEVSDVQVGGIVRFAIGLFVLLVASCLLMWGLYRALSARVKEPERSPMALKDNERLPPEPRLQGAPGFGESIEKSGPSQDLEKAVREGRARGPELPRDPLWEIRSVRAQWNDVLEKGPVDQNGRRYGMPIEEAKKKLLEQGLPVRRH